jgi:hypothetical protein
VRAGTCGGRLNLMEQDCSLALLRKPVEILADIEAKL